MSPIHNDLRVLASDSPHIRNWARHSPSTFNQSTRPFVDIPTFSGHIRTKETGGPSTLSSPTLTQSSTDTSSPPSPSQDVVSPSGEDKTYHYQPQQLRMRLENGELCFLCLDGGGVRGYGSLLNLKSLLRRLQPEGKIFPYLYFDVICGTSTGGLIALLLGVLYLDIDTAIKLYQKLSKEIFGQSYSRLRVLTKGAGYDRKPLVLAINKILKKHGEGRTLMEDPSQYRGCYCFVTTTHCVGQRRDVLPIRSYRVSGEQGIPHGYSWKIVDAALATSAAPGYFDPYDTTVDGTQFSFEDAGAYGRNNPTELALEECRKLGGARNGKSLFISLGTGSSAASIEPAPGFFGLFQDKMTSLHASARCLTNVNDVDDRMQKEANRSKTNISYRRLGPRLPGKIGLADWNKIPAMQAIATEYQNEHRKQFHRGGDQLRRFQTTGKKQAPDYVATCIKLLQL